MAKECLVKWFDDWLKSIGAVYELFYGVAPNVSLLHVFAARAMSLWSMVENVTSWTYEPSLDNWLGILW